MSLRIFSTLAAVSLLLPIGAYAVQFNPEINSHQGESATIMAQYEGKRGDFGERWQQELDLTPEQQEQIQAITTQSRTETESLREQLQQAKAEMRSLLSSDADSAQLRQQHQSMQELHQQLSDQRFETRLEIREVLTPEQRTELAELMEQGHRGRGHHRRR